MVEIISRGQEIIAAIDGRLGGTDFGTWCTVFRQAFGTLNALHFLQ
jgi:hypothetical protein